MAIQPRGPIRDGPGSEQKFLQFYELVWLDLLVLRPGSPSVASIKFVLEFPLETGG